jgi:hypothetical protein
MTKKEIIAGIAREQEMIRYYTETVYTLDACRFHLEKPEVEKMANFHREQSAMYEKMLADKVWRKH